MTGDKDMSEPTIVTGPQDISEMTDREIAEETLYWLRQAGQALANIQQQGIMGMMKNMRG